MLEATLLSLLPKEVIEVINNINDGGELTSVKRYEGKKKKRVLITSDCMAEIPSELLEKFNIRLMYLYIKTPNGRFADTIEPIPVLQAAEKDVLLM